MRQALHDGAWRFSPSASKDDLGGSSQVREVGGETFGTENSHRQSGVLGGHWRDQLG